MFFYTVEDWSINPCNKKGLSLREVIDECTSLEDEEIQKISNMMIGDVFAEGEFSITCTNKTA